MPRFAANLSMLFTERPFLDRFAAAAAAGFDAVECQFPYDWPAADIRARLDACGLAMVLHNLPAGDWAAGERGIACLPGRESEFRAGVEQGIAYARVLGVPRLNCLAGLTPAGADDALLRRTFIANLGYAAAALADAGLELLVEPINTVDMPGFWLNRGAQALELIAEVGAANLRLQFDAYHAAAMGDEPGATLQACFAQVGHIQVADHPGRHEPGSGTIGCAALFALIDRLGYAGHVGAEYRPAAGTEAGLGWLTRARGCARSCD
ncbi:MAG TPA: hydroxypyruvate isomerase [Methylibium sp.]|nr:hydroxypyruvate isomerase [Methylibium sp.]